MIYHSTRGQAPALPFADVVLTGLAADGGLYLPETYPAINKTTLEQWKSLDYKELAVEVISLYAKELPKTTITLLVDNAYSTFHHTAIAPLTQLASNQWLLELFHGQTLAFKDYALQFLGTLTGHLLKERKQYSVVIGATSGDTGSAAIEGMRHAGKHVTTVILHPAGRPSAVQRRQMTTVIAPNVHNLALDGTFDDCQAIVKALFADATFRTTHNLMAVNSINWARILAQVVYYAYTSLRLSSPVSFVVPTGNFGNVFAGWVAKTMGFPIDKFYIASNSNDILPRFFKTGTMQAADVRTTLSPSMDIQVSSNFERLLFEVSGRDAALVHTAMQAFNTDKHYTVPAPVLHRLQETFTAVAVNDAQILETIAHTHRTTGQLIDPHTACAVHLMNTLPQDAPVVSLACAHAAKFPDAVRQATGITPALPAFLADLHSREERCTTLPASLDAVHQFITNLK